MKKYAMRFLTLVLAVVLMSTLAVSASAAGTDRSSYSMQNARVSSPFPFTMFIQNASKDINTMNNSAKSFTKAGITEGNVTTYGKIILSHVEGKYSAGIGYYDGSKVRGFSELYTIDQANNSMFNRGMAVQNLVAGRTYFLFAENTSIYSCTMHGTVSADVYW